jgi:hypothetical protein
MFVTAVADVASVDADAGSICHVSSFELPGRATIGVVRTG